MQRAAYLERAVLIPLRGCPNQESLIPVLSAFDDLQSHERDQANRQNITALWSTITWED